MKDKSYLTFFKLDYGPDRKTDVYNVHSGTFIVGIVKWYTHWRRYVFYPSAETLFDAACLTEITLFITGLMNDRKRANEEPACSE